ncbi:MAG: sugar ABC transporter permease [Roseibacillus sp.]|jgi:ribose transport system permease protein|nr:sugar ABC transporter permease [Roseibacillus sp.]MBP36585.1 sugar ABC transporter permease [Roseibacillus sp.]HJM64579.1 ABC transporter permease [Roseibacillus sp.]|tara:strand:- start:5597 stop:6574 length:978 start_codon:yes stop_codon:yes gene_type:complete
MDVKSETPIRKLDLVGRIQSQASLGTLVALCVIASFCFPEFPRQLNLTNIVRQISMTGLVSIGMTFVILSGGIDLSVGSTAAAASVLAARLSREFGLMAVGAPILLGIFIGAVNGMLITRARIPPFIATLAMMLGARGLAFILAGGEPVGADPSSWLYQIAKTDLLGFPCLGIIFLLTLGVAIVVARYTGFGRSLYAIGGNEEAAVMMGLNVNHKKMLVYMICGGLAGAAGMLLTSRINSGQPTAAAGWELTAIAAVVIGGTSLTGGRGKMGHTLYGVLILGVISNVINLEGTLSYWYANLITGVLLLAVVLLQSRIAGGRIRDT